MIIPLSKRFETLSKKTTQDPMDDDSNIDDCREDTEKNTKLPNNKKMPPIEITQEMEDYSKFIKRLKDFTRGEPKVHSLEIS